MRRGVLCRVEYRGREKEVEVRTENLLNPTVEEAKASTGLKSITSCVPIVTEVEYVRAKELYGRGENIYVKYKDNGGVRYCDNGWGGHAPLETYFERTYDEYRPHVFLYNGKHKMKKYEVYFTEFDSLHVGYEGEPFIVEATSYEEAEKKARKELEDAYYIFEFEVFEVEEDDDEDDL